MNHSSWTTHIAAMPLVGKRVENEGLAMTSLHPVVIQKRKKNAVIQNKKALEPRKMPKNALFKSFS